MIVSQEAAQMPILEKFIQFAKDVDHDEQSEDYEGQRDSTDQYELAMQQ